ncbi:IS5/IS1182 family transposase, partial [Streptomyces sp. NPDC047141]
MRRHELTDESWALIGPLLAPGRMGRPVRDRRQVV